MEISRNKFKAKEMSKNMQLSQLASEN